MTEKEISPEDEDKFIEMIGDIYSLIPTLDKGAREAVQGLLRGYTIEFLNKISGSDIRHVSMLAKKEISRRNTFPKIHSPN